jgi:hypothetical protein
MEVTPDNPETATGAELFAVERFPNWPDPLAPQQSTLPSDNNAHEWYAPAAIEITPDNPETATGVNRIVVDPSPNCPELLDPKHFTAPSENSAQEWS